MTITVGQLVAEIFDAYGRQLGDDELAAVATEVRLVELGIPPHRRRRRGARPTRR